MRFNVYAFLSLILVLAACSRPVIRSERKEEVQTEEQRAEALARADLKKRVWVLPFLESGEPVKSKGLEKVNVTEVLQKELGTSLSEDRGPFLVTDEDIAALREMSVDSGTPAPDVARLGRGSGVVGFLRGEIVSLEQIEKTAPEGLLKNRTLELKLTISYELFDASSARRITGGNLTESYAETRSDLFGSGDRSIPEPQLRLIELAQKMGPKVLAKVAPFAEKLGWEGRVLRTDSNRVYLNAGRRTGIQVGDVLKVVEASKEIVDPSSGSFIGQAPGRMKGTLKVIQHFGLDGSVAVLQSGGGVRPGDRVELY